MSNISQQITSLAHERKDCDAIELRNHTISSAPSGNNRENIVEHNNEKDEEPNSTPTKDEVSRETLEKGETFDKFIDKYSPFRRKKPNPQ